MDRTTESVQSNTFDDVIHKYRVEIDQAIETELDKHVDSLFSIPVKHAIVGGKRLRPILLVASFDSVKTLQADPFPAAVAVELAHLESLIHDDIIDGDAQRRETAAFHATHGREMALLSADFILSMILDITARYDNPRIAQILARATSTMCEGELEEIKICENKSPISIDEYINLVSRKTASLFEASAEIGATIGGGEEEEIRALATYGRSLGIAYQILDDIKDSDRKTAVNVISLLPTGSRTISKLHETSRLFMLEAKHSLGKIRNDESKVFLTQLADFVLSSSAEWMKQEGSSAR
jgi:octaprenyl-diphosphate synthase